jgi:HlyD family secretion protein
VSYLSPKPEFTPPVLYNRENRAKLVFLVEATFADTTAARDLHPGQPADVAPRCRCSLP